METYFPGLTRKIDFSNLLWKPSWFWLLTLESISQNFPRTGKLLDLEKHSCQKKHKTIFLTFCYFIVEKTSTPKTQKVYLWYYSTKIFYTLFRSWPDACNFIKMRPWLKCFPVNFAKFLRIPFLQNTTGRLVPNFWCRRLEL